MSDTGFYLGDLGRVTHSEALKIIWRHTHADYRGRLAGKKTILVNRGGSCLVELDALTDDEIADKLKLCVKAEIRRRFQVLFKAATRGNVR